MVKHFQSIRKKRSKWNDNSNNNNNCKIIITVLNITMTIVIIKNSESCPEELKLVDGAAQTMLFLCSGLEEKETHRPYNSI